MLCNEGYVHGSCVPSPVGVPAQMGPVPLKGPVHVSPMGCWVPAPVFSISWEGPAHESPLCCEGRVNKCPLILS